MLDNLLFSLNMCLPLFFVMGAGWLLARRGLFTDDYRKKTIDLIYYVLLPSKLFLETAAMDLSAAMDGRYALVAAGGVIFQFILVWYLSSVLCKDKSKQGAFAHASFRSNFAYLGLPLLQNIYGTTSLPSVAIVYLIIIPLYNIEGIVLLTVKEQKGKLRMVQLLLSILKNPMVAAIFLGLPLAYFKLSLPFSVEKSLGYFQASTNAMALLVVGASIKFGKIKSDIPNLLKISSLKLLLMPFIWALLGLLAGLDKAQIVTLIFVGAMPTAVNVYVITNKMGGDGDLAAGALMSSCILSLFTLTLIIFILRTLAFI